MRKLFALFTVLTILFLGDGIAQVNKFNLATQVKGVLARENGGSGTSEGAWQTPLFDEGTPNPSRCTSLNFNQVYFDTSSEVFSEYICSTGPSWVQISGGGGGSGLPVNNPTFTGTLIGPQIEQIVNPNFTTPQPGGNLLSTTDVWTLGTGWTGTYNGLFTQTGSSTNLVDSSFTPATNSVYSVTFSIFNPSAGTIKVYLGGQTDGNTYSSSGVYTSYIPVTSTTAPLTFVSTDFSGSITGISVNSNLVGPNDSWSLGSGDWTGSYQTGFTATNANDAVVDNTFAPSSGTFYFASFIVSASQGCVELNVGNNNIGCFSTGSQERLVFPAYNNSSLQFIGQENFTGTVSQILLQTLSPTEPTYSLYDIYGNNLLDIRTNKDYSLYVGANSGQSSASTSEVGVGYGALANSNGGYGNSAVGYDTLAANAVGSYNTASGFLALSTNNIDSNGQVGVGNTADGFVALVSNLSGLYNTSIGYYSMVENTVGNYNTAVGINTLESNVLGSDNVAVGASALENSTTGNNTAVGNGALNGITAGSDNTALGSGAGSDYANTTYGVFIGENAQATQDSTTNEIVIGYDAVGAGSNSTTIGTSSITKLVLWGCPTGQFALADGSGDCLAMNTVSVNSSSVSNPNLNGTTPAAGSGQVNCVWQVSGSNVSCYIPVPTQTKVFNLAITQYGNTQPSGCSSFSTNAPNYVDIGDGTNTNVVGVPALIAGASASQVLSCPMVVPANFGGTISVSFNLADTVASDTVTMYARAACTYSPANPSFGTPVSVSPSMSSTPGTVITTNAITVTPSGTCTAGEPMYLQFYRYISDGGTGSVYTYNVIAQYTGSL